MPRKFTIINPFDEGFSINRRTGSLVRKRVCKDTDYQKHHEDSYSDGSSMLSRSASVPFQKASKINLTNPKKKVSFAIPITEFSGQRMPVTPYYPPPPRWHKDEEDGYSDRSSRAGTASVSQLSYQTSSQPQALDATHPGPYSVPGNHPGPQGAYNYEAPLHPGEPFEGLHPNATSSDPRHSRSNSQINVRPSSEGSRSRHNQRHERGRSPPLEHHTERDSRSWNTSNSQSSGSSLSFRPPERVRKPQNRSRSESRYSSSGRSRDPNPSVITHTTSTYTTQYPPSQHPGSHRSQTRSSPRTSFVHVRYGRPPRGRCDDEQYSPTTATRRASRDRPKPPYVGSSYSSSLDSSYYERPAAPRASRRRGGNGDRYDNDV